MKVLTKYDLTGKKTGTFNKGITKTDKSQYEDSDIKCCLEKYGMGALLCQNAAAEPLYLDNTYRNLNVADAVRLRNELKEYYLNLPAKVRKAFGDNPDIFYEKYKQGEFNEMKMYGILTDEMEENINEERKAANTSTNNTNTSDDKSSVGDIQSTEGTLQQ